MNIDIETYKISNDNYYIDEYEKRQIILAGSLRKDNYHIIRLQNREFGKTKTWNTFTISRDGLIYQHYDPKYYTDFMNDKTIDKYSISIVLENMGPLIKNKYNLFVNTLNETYASEIIPFKKLWNNLTYWEIYTEKQFESTLNLCKYLCNLFKINKNVINFNSFNQNTKEYYGIVSRSNYSNEYTDLNPSFNLIKFGELLNE